MNEHDQLLDKEGGANEPPQNDQPAEGDKPKDDENREPNKDEEDKPPEVSDEHISKRVKYNYTYLDGLRGIGAFSVYLNHSFLKFYPFYKKEELEDGKEKHFPPDFMRTTPIRIIYEGYVWVMVFFILSGFVLPMNFFRTGR